MSSPSDSTAHKEYDEASTRSESFLRLPNLLEYSGHIRRLLGLVLHALRPAYTKHACKPTKLRRTAYLDGIRGFAALLVYWLHHELWSHEALNADAKLQSAWGYDGQYYLATFPFIRTFFTGGHYAVAIFFVLSGYVLSTKPLALINAGEFSMLGDNLASGLFRRWGRLYLPILCVTFALVAFSHLFNIPADFIPQSSYGGEVWNWYLETKAFTFVFRLSGDPTYKYHAHVWSIPIDMRGSIVIYTVLLALSRCTRKARLWSEAALTMYLMYIVDGAHYAMFTAGMFLCDFDYLSAEDGLPSWLNRWEVFREPFLHVLLVISVYLGGVPSHDRDINGLRQSPGWHFLSLLKPQAVFDYKWFYNFIAATTLVFTVTRIAWLKCFFETRFCQYLGRISYMFYLLHGPILWTLGDRLYAAVGWSKESHAMTIPGWSGLLPIPAIGPFGMELNFLIPHLILLPLTFWFAEVATTLIDDPSTAFCAWTYRQVTSPSPARRLP